MQQDQGVIVNLFSLSPKTTDPRSFILTDSLTSGMHFHQLIWTKVMNQSRVNLKVYSGTQL